MKLLLNHILITIILLIYSINTFSQISTKRFEKKISFSGGNYIPYEICNTKDSGYCILGFAELPSQDYRITITRLDKFGNILWSNKYSHALDTFNSPSAIVNTFDNGFLITGATFKNSALSIYTLTPLCMKIDSSGNIQWAKSYPLLNGDIRTIKEFSDSTLCLFSEYYQGNTPISLLQKLDKNGNILWSKKLSFFYELVEKSNHHIQIFGNSSTGFILKEFDKNGIELWEKKYNNTKYVFNAWGMNINNKNETIIFSDLRDTLPTFDNGLYVLKTDSVGNILFSNYYSGDWSAAQVYTCEFSGDCGIIANSRLYFQGFGDKQTMLKLDLNGNVDWLKVYTSPLYTEAKFVIATPDFGYASLGHVTDSGQFYAKVIKTDINGKTSCNNDSSILVTKTNTPLTINTILHTSTFVSSVNSNVSIIVQPNFVSVETYCSDEVIIDTIFNCNKIVKISETLIDEETIIIPNVFTPNNDDRNEYFKINIKTYVSFKIDIYNRWGTQVFHSENPEISWNGRLENKLQDADDGTYFYIIKINKTTDNVKKYKGFLTLTR